MKSGYADADQLGLCYPAPEDDPVNQRVKSRTVGVVFKSYQEAGARCLVLAGSVYSKEEVAMYTGQFPEATLTLCMLQADPETIRQRFLQKRWKPELVSEAVKQAIELGRADFVDLRVDTSARSVAEVARLVRARAGDWPGLG
jgi:hypothetical protein